MLCVVVDEIECSGINWFVNFAPNKDKFHDTIHFFTPDQEEDTKQLIRSHPTK